MAERLATSKTVTPTGIGVSPADSVTALGVSAGDSGLAQGTTVIDDAVIAKVVGIAAREVPGVFALGGSAARAVGAIRQAIGAVDFSQGVRVEVGATHVAVDVAIVTEYPRPIRAIADGVRTSITAAIENLVGMTVAEINVTVSDVHIPGDDDVNASEPPEAVR